MGVVEGRELDKLMGKALSYKGDRNYPEAIRSYAQAISINPTFFNAYLGLAECYGGSGLRPEFSALLQKAQEIFPVGDIYAFRLQEAFDLASHGFK